MENYICLRGRKTELTEEQVCELLGQVPDPEATACSLGKLGAKPIESVVTIGEREYIVMDHGKEENITLLLMKDLLEENVVFGETNNDYRESNVRKLLDDFAVELEKIVGAGNLIQHSVDLTSDDGLKDYGLICCKVSLLTTDLYRKYGSIIDHYKLDRYWWLLTPHSTKTHENEEWVKCVSPCGDVDYGYYNYDRIGGRPFCILNSDILVS